MTTRRDNGSEYISSTLRAWAEKRAIQTSFTQLRQPQQNAYIERYNRTVRYDWLAHYLFESVDDGSGIYDEMALDRPSRTPEHGARWHHPHSRN